MDEKEEKTYYISNEELMKLNDLARSLSESEFAHEQLANPLKL